MPEKPIHEYSTVALLAAIKRLTHSIHSAKDDRIAVAYRKQREIAEAEILRRAGE